MWGSQVNKISNTNITMSNINNMDIRCGAIACLQLSNSMCWENYTAYHEEVVNWEFKSEGLTEVFYDELNGAMRVWLEKMIRGNTNISFYENLNDEMDILIDEFEGKGWITITREEEEDDEEETDDEEPTDDIESDEEIDDENNLEFI
jgi:hypothetical protein